MAIAEGPKPVHEPPYPEMILAAIKALNDKSGSSEAAISANIEEKYDDLPDAHASMLAEHLEHMTDGGELVLSKNGGYSRPTAPTAAAPKRGRGRPPKPKDPKLKPDASAPKRGRGRPPKRAGPGRPPKRKATDALASPAKVRDPAASPRPRGRPPKAKDPAASAAAPKATGGTPRSRGRPPKRPKVASNGPPVPAPTASGAAPAKRGRGRPPKAKA